MAYQKLTPIIATGATAPRYLGDRFADIANVKDFGAVGDGVADDTTAFTAAQNSGAQAVMVPCGTYKITEDVAGTFFSFGETTTTGGGDVEIIDILSFDSIANQLSNNIQSKVALDGSNVSSIGSTLSEYMAHAGMPSERFIELSVPASGGFAIVPADGFLLLGGTTSNTGYNFLQLYSVIGNKCTIIDTSGVRLFTSLPVSKGSSVEVTYSSGMASLTLAFCYANGAL